MYRVTARIDALDRGTHASVEVDRKDVERQLRDLGYEDVVIDEEGFRSGNLNRAIARD